MVIPCQANLEGVTTSPDECMGVELEIGTSPIIGNEVGSMSKCETTSFEMEEIVRLPIKVSNEFEEIV